MYTAHSAQKERLIVIPNHYVWLFWSCAFLIPWIGIFALVPQLRRIMWWASLFTMPFGLTEPLFVPRYWNPPSLFDLARTTGFDIESLIFSFGIGGVGAVLYDLLRGRRTVPLPAGERRHHLHRYHRLALATPFAVFPALYFLPWNPIYPGITAMFLGAIATALCRPDLSRKTWIGGLLFLGYYGSFFLALEWSAPGYIARVWNFSTLSGMLVFGIPLEELLFAFAFGLYWSGAYEHFTWHRDAPVR